MIGADFGIRWRSRVQDRKQFVKIDVIELPVLPLRDVVVYPHMVIPLFVGREKSIRRSTLPWSPTSRSCWLRRRSPDVDEPGPGDLYAIGTVATVLQLLKLPDGTIKVLVEGVPRRNQRILRTQFLLTGRVRALESVYTRNEREIEVISRSLVSLFEQYVKLNARCRRNCSPPWPARGSFAPCRHHCCPLVGEAAGQAANSRDSRCC
jgi:ATP-dependent Lon protease